jgi:hypothetical protein
MSAAIDPIIITLGLGGQTVSRVGFGNPLIVGFTGSRSVLISGSGQSQAIYKSTVRGDTLSIQVTQDVGYAYTLNGDTVEITVPSGATVRELVADYEANASAPIKAKVIIEAGSLGLGAVTLIAAPVAAAGLTGKVKIVDISQLQYYYDTTDAEYQMFQDQFDSAPSPKDKYLLDVFGSADPSADVQAVDDGTWYCLLTTSVTQSEQQELAEYIVTVKRICIFVSATTADAQVLTDKRIIYVIHDTPADHPENAWAAICLPNDPGSITWAYQGPLAGQTPNATATLPDLLAVRAANAQSYVEKDNLKYMDEGLTTEESVKTFIDQVRSRDWIELNLDADLLALLVNTPKIPYTNSGIDQVKDTIADRLELAGDAGIIKPIETQAEAETASSKNYVFIVRASTRQEIEEASPADITNRELNGVTFQFSESGAIHSISAGGTVIIPS